MDNRSKIVDEVELTWGLAEFAEHTKHLTAEIELNDTVGMAVGHVDGILALDVEESPRVADVGPFVDKTTTFIEDLYAAVGAVGDVDEAAPVDADVDDVVHEYHIQGDGLTQPFDPRDCATNGARSGSLMQCSEFCPALVGRDAQLIAAFVRT